MAQNFFLAPGFRCFAVQVSGGFIPGFIPGFMPWFQAGFHIGFIPLRVSYILVWFHTGFMTVIFLRTRLSVARPRPRSQAVRPVFFDSSPPLRRRPSVLCRLHIW